MNLPEIQTMNRFLYSIFIYTDDGEKWLLHSKWNIIYILNIVYYLKRFDVVKLLYAKRRFTHLRILHHPQILKKTIVSRLSVIKVGRHRSRFELWTICYLPCDRAYSLAYMALLPEVVPLQLYNCFFGNIWQEEGLV
jgi:hypothetical protein